MIFIFYLFIFLFGITVGSFLNVLIDRPIQGKSINGRSICDYCHHQLAWYDLIPIVSFFLLKGRCRYCQKKLSWQYPVVELLTGISFLSIFVFYFKIFNNFSIFSLQFLKILVIFGLVSTLIVILFSDFKYHLVSDHILIGFFVFSFLYHLVNYNLQFIYFLTSGFLVSLPIFFLYHFTREKAMGLGDVYMSFIIGFLLGWQKGFLALYIGFLTGAVVSLILIILRQKKIKSKIAFGPFLILGLLTMVFYGDKIIELLKKIYGF